MNISKYIYSQLSADFVEKIVASQYDLLAPIRCTYYAQGLHDNYLIETTRDKYILRIYRNDWRSLEEIEFEIDLLMFLGNRDANVSSPINTTTSEPSFLIDSPEGKRSAALFPYADGKAPGDKISTSESKLLGNTVAKMHSAATPFKTAYSRPTLETPYLLDQSINAIDPFIDEQSKRDIERLQGFIKHYLPAIPKTNETYGACSGDINSTNFHINQNDQITLFDFDQCGFGYRAFEIGKYISSLHSNKNKQALSNAFIEGYQEKRQLTQEELSAIPYYEMISIIWVMAIHAYNVDKIGHKYLDKDYWDYNIATAIALQKSIS